MTMYREMPKKK